MSLKQSSKIRITGQPGIKTKYPRFCLGFLGLEGKVTGFHKTNEQLIQVIVTESPIWINRNWVTAL